jgi:hypothetical protein
MPYWVITPAVTVHVVPACRQVPPVMLSETDPAVMWIVAGPSHSTSTTPFPPGCRPWLQEVPEIWLPEPPLLPSALLAGAPTATAVPGWLVAMALPEPLPSADAVAGPPPPVLADPLLLPMGPHPAMFSATAASSVAMETTVVVRDI